LTRKKQSLTDIARLGTEQSDPAASDLDRKSALEIARIINDADSTVAAAVRRALPQIGRAIDVVAASLRAGGKVIYVGAGTSGRIAALDACECPPTFNVPVSAVQFVIAGGTRALSAAAEASEDDAGLGRSEIAKRKPGRKDVVVGIASSGRTPFTVAAIEEAGRRGAKTIALTCNRNSPLERASDFAIVTEVGPEVLAGSSRMKAATAHKMVLNTISTGAMTRLGYVYGNFMVNVEPRNEKLVERATRILQQAAVVDHDTARQALENANRRTPVALVMLVAGVTRSGASAALKRVAGNVRKAISLAKSR
jgi:N-acetylmuramic acid 6-phosphate etherase